MTPQRNQYLNKCGRIEKLLRKKIKDSKNIIISGKRFLGDLEQIPEPCRVWQVEDVKRELKREKDRYTIYKLALMACTRRTNQWEKD